MQDVVGEIKSRIDIVDLISDYVQLKSAGTSFRALCPFHKEKTPSFFVSPERQIWHCFGSCNEGGDIFKFVMKMENVDFPEALRILAKRAGVQIERQDYHLVSQRTKLADIMKIAAKFYHLILTDSPLAEKARAYLKERGLKSETIKEFQLGFAPERWDELWKFLTKKGFKESDAALAGLIIKSNIQQPSSSIKYHDRFRNRIMFPVSDLYGNPVGFSARLVPWSAEKEAGKYINTPETPIYNKSKILYGLDKAKQVIKQKDAVILVEGNMDVVSCHQAESKNVVASSGTALTLEQIKLLKRYTNNLLLAFDVDLAGENATQRGIDVALQEELNVKIIKVPGSKDPDECIREDSEKWFKAVEEVQSIMDYYFNLAFDGRDPKKVEDKKTITKILLSVIDKLGDPVERDHWLKILASKIDIAEYSLRDKIKNFKKTKTYNAAKEKEADRASREKMVGEIFLGLVVTNAELAVQYFLELPTEAFVTAELQELAQMAKDDYNFNKNIDLERIKIKINNLELANYLDYLGLLIEKEFLIAPIKSTQDKANKKIDLNAEIKKLACFLNERYLCQKRSGITELLKEAEKNKDQSKIKELTSKIAEINKNIGEL